ncbi:hypothetical protein GCM10025864_20960 [Luteimicrobium album]|uniref:ROK family protein n=1 Tax=Luteimicrobium album TaxID=1054550 RepID=A0ABQ6I1K2_9MICO|nr:ROK family protein [Luteimicrobium album]GMA24337.1 hypothetical protein GCM10025864_20960 [Luteimicrobium album]
MELPGVGTPKARQASLREHNLALVARSVFGAAEPPSRAAVAVATGLTRATVGSLVDQLVAGRVVAELAPAPGQVGRPAVPLVPAPRTVVGLGLEVNVDYVGVRALDLSGATVAERIEGAPGGAPADFSGSDPVRVLARVGDLARDVVAEIEAEGMRVAGTRLALPGLVDARAGFLQVAPNLGWESLAPVPLLGPLPAGVEIANEANLAGLAQLPFGQFAASGHDGTTFVHVSGDVGIGAAIVLDGQLYLGRHGWAGEIGHVVVDPSGPRCRCGATGCLEQLAGKDAILRGLGLDAPGTTRPDGAASDGLAPVLDALAAGGEAGSGRAPSSGAPGRPSARRSRRSSTCSTSTRSSSAASTRPSPTTCARRSRPSCARGSWPHRGSGSRCARRPCPGTRRSPGCARRPAGPRAGTQRLPGVSGDGESAEVGRRPVLPRRSRDAAGRGPVRQIVLAFAFTWMKVQLAFHMLRTWMDLPGRGASMILLPPT